MRQEQIEQPTRIRVGRMIGSAPRQSEEALTAKVSSRLDDEVTARMWAMIAAAGDDPGDQAAESAGDPGEAGEATGPEGLAYSSSEKQRLGSRPGNESWICPVWLCVGVRRGLNGGIPRMEPKRDFSWLKDWRVLTLCGGCLFKD